jgi:hypothetical protein
LGACFRIGWESHLKVLKEVLQCRKAGADPKVHYLNHQILLKQGVLGLLIAHADSIAEEILTEEQLLPDSESGASFGVDRIKNYSDLKTVIRKVLDRIIQSVYEGISIVKLESLLNCLTRDSRWRSFGRHQSLNFSFDKLS